MNRWFERYRGIVLMGLFCAIPSVGNTLLEEFKQALQLGPKHSAPRILALVSDEKNRSAVHAAVDKLWNELVAYCYRERLALADRKPVELTPLFHVIHHLRRIDESKSIVPIVELLPVLLNGGIVSPLFDNFPETARAIDEALVRCPSPELLEGSVNLAFELDDEEDFRRLYPWMVRAIESYRVDVVFHTIVALEHLHDVWEVPLVDLKVAKLPLMHYLQQIDARRLNAMKKRDELGLFDGIVGFSAFLFAKDDAYLNLLQSLYRVRRTLGDLEYQENLLWMNALRVARGLSTQDDPEEFARHELDDARRWLKKIRGFDLRQPEAKPLVAIARSMSLRIGDALPKLGDSKEAEGYLTKFFSRRNDIRFRVFLTQSLVRQPRITGLLKRNPKCMRLIERIGLKEELDKASDFSDFF